MTTPKSLFWPSEAQTDYQKIVIVTVLVTSDGVLLIIVLLNYGTLAKLILAKLASKNRMPGFMRPVLVHCVVEKLKMKTITYLDRFENKTIIRQYQSL